MQNFIDLFSYGFFLNAFIASILAAVTCGIAGTYIVSRRIVFISGGITHASFGGIGIAYFLGLNPVLGAAVFSLLTAFGIEHLTRKAEIRNDSVIAMLWSLGMAIGVIFIYLTPGYAPNLMGYLFGSILTVNRTDLFLLTADTIIIILFFIFYNRLILFISFDENYAATQKVPVLLINYILISLVSFTIVLNIKVVGIILVLSLLTIPQNAANLFTKNFNRILIYSVILAFAGTFSGLIVSYYLNIPSGATIIFCLAIIYLIIRLFTGFRKKRKLILNLNNVNNPE